MDVSAAAKRRLAWGENRVGVWAYRRGGGFGGWAYRGVGVLSMWAIGSYAVREDRGRVRSESLMAHNADTLELFDRDSDRKERPNRCWRVNQGSSLPPGRRPA